jgi:hypothetical protein
MQPTVDSSKKKGDIPSTPTGMYTSPAKRGGYGVPKTTISERAGPQGVLGEYGWAAEPYSRPREIAKQDAAVQRSHRHTELPFKPSSPGKHGTFGVPGSHMALTHCAVSLGILGHGMLRDD